MLYRHYLGGQAEPLKLLLNREDPNQIARRLHYFGYISRARAELIAGLRAGLAQLRELAQEAEQKAAELSAVTAEQRAQRSRLEREKRARNQVLARISRDIERQRREIGTMKRDENAARAAGRKPGEADGATPSPPRGRAASAPRRRPRRTAPLPGSRAG